MTPQHTHHCDQCTYIGSINGMDAYYHKRNWGTEYLLRLDSEQTNYYSKCDDGDKIAYNLKLAYNEYVTNNLARLVTIRIFAPHIADSMK